MKRRLSSRSTFIMKYVFSLSWIGVFGLFTLLMLTGAIKSKPLRGAAPPPVGMIKWIMLSTWVMGTGFILSTSAPLKRVFADESSLYVSNYWKEQTIEQSEVIAVRENRFINVNGKNPVTVKLKSGAKFVFIPTGKRPFSWPWKPVAHPIVAELQALAERNSRS